jgi:hypothetical protein
MNMFETHLMAAYELAAMRERAEAAEAELERMRTKCFGCITPAEHVEALASAKAEVEELREGLGL